MEKMSSQLNELKKKSEQPVMHSPRNVMPDSSTVTEVSPVEKQRQKEQKVEFENLNKKLDTIKTELMAQQVKLEQYKNNEPKPDIQLTKKLDQMLTEINQMTTENANQFSMIRKENASTKRTVDELKNNTISKATVISVIDSEKTAIMNEVAKGQESQKQLMGLISELREQQNTGHIQLSRNMTGIIDNQLKGTLIAAINTAVNTAINTVIKVRLNTVHCNEFSILKFFIINFLLLGRTVQDGASN